MHVSDAGAVSTLKSLLVDYIRGHDLLANVDEKAAALAHTCTYTLYVYTFTKNCV